MRLKRGIFTVNNSFREENYDDPEAKGRRLSEFTLIEPEKPYEGLHSEKALGSIIEEESEVVKYAIQKVLKSCSKDVSFLGGDLYYLQKVLSSRFQRISYDEALGLLNEGGGNYKFGDDLETKEERNILKYFNNIPVFVTYYPAEIKFFNMKRTPDGKRVYSVDLLTPKLGETTGGAVREEDGKVIKQHLSESKIGKFLRENGQDPITQFTEYFNLFEQEKPILRGGYGIGFERFVGFLLRSNDILDTIAYRTLHPI
jgi:asparaginyl-tRNA synthetase